MNVVKKAFGTSTRIKVLILCVVVLILAASIMCGRLVWFQQGLYQTPDIATVDVGAVPTRAAAALVVELRLRDPPGVPALKAEDPDHEDPELVPLDEQM